MMEKFDIFINKICNKVNDMIPEEWNKVYIYGEVTEGAGVVAFYYYPQDKDIYVFSADIIDLFDIDENEFSNDEYELLKLFEQLQQEFKNSDQEVWTSVTIYLESTGKFKVDYDYTDLSDVDDYNRQIIWEYKHLGVMPEDEDDKKIVEEYINGIENK